MRGSIPAAAVVVAFLVVWVIGALMLRNLADELERHGRSRWLAFYPVMAALLLWLDRRREERRFR